MPLTPNFRRSETPQPPSQDLRRLTQVRGPLLAQFEATQPALLETMRKTIPGMPPKAQRWVGEMEQMAITFADAGLAPHIFQGAGELFGIVSRTELGSEVPENRRRGTGMDEVIDIIADAVRRLARPDDIR